MEPKEKITVYDIQTVRTYLRVLQSIILKEKMQKEIIKQICLSKAHVSEVVKILKRARLIDKDNQTGKYYVPVNFLVREFAEQMRVFKEEEIVYLIDLVNSCKKSIAKSRIPDIEEFLNLSNEKDETDGMTFTNQYYLKKLRYSPPLLFLFLIMRSEAVIDLDEKNKIFNRFLKGLWLISWKEEMKSSCKILAKVLKNIKDEGFEAIWVEEFGFDLDSSLEFLLSIDSKQKDKGK
ncbi:MAG: hypothetical protein ACXADY_02935 [Candidatus Hodarchaeales archaeon]|jgi:hypothetical protein